MAKKDSVSNLSSAELYDLAKEREQEELAVKREAAKEKIDALKLKRRKLLAKHKQELAKIDAEIVKLGGKTPDSSPRKRSSTGNISAEVVAAITEAGQINIQDLKAALAQKGVIAGNLGQTIAYLKSRGKITCPSRAVYRLAE